MTDETEAPQAPQQVPPDPEQAARLRAALRENFGKIVMAMMQLPRYRNQLVSDLQASVLDPMLRDRIAIAYPTKAQSDGASDMAGFALWASVSEEVDAKIREQIKASVWPLRLRPADWNSGSIHWLLDVVAQDKAMTATVISNFRKLTGEDTLRLHPIITRLVDAETLEKMGMRRTHPGDGADAMAGAGDEEASPPAEPETAEMPDVTRH